MQRAISKLVAVGLVVGLSACGGSGGGGSPTAPGGTNSSAPPTPSPQAATIAATVNLAFDPSSVTVAPGGSVTFAFGAVGHTVVFDAANAPASITSPTTDTSITRTFPSAGTFTFHCTVHPGMTGTVIVADQSTSTNGTPPSGYGIP